MKNCRFFAAILALLVCTTGLWAQVSVGAYQYEVSTGTFTLPADWTDFRLKPTLDTVSGKWWKSHATLTLLAKQDCPLWLQYD